MLAGDLKVGQLVYSRAGRDRGRPFLVWQVAGNGRVYLVDGNLRSTAKPKLKNVIHVQAVNMVDTGIAERLYRGDSISDADIRRVITRLTTPGGLEKEGGLFE